MILLSNKVALYFINLLLIFFIMNFLLDLGHFEHTFLKFITFLFILLGLSLRIFFSIKIFAFNLTLGHFHLLCASKLFRLITGIYSNYTFDNFRIRFLTFFFRESGLLFIRCLKLLLLGILIITFILKFIIDIFLALRISSLYFFRRALSF